MRGRGRWGVISGGRGRKRAKKVKEPEVAQHYLLLRRFM